MIGKGFIGIVRGYATVAQLVEHFTRNEKVRSSILRGGSKVRSSTYLLEKAEGADEVGAQFDPARWLSENKRRLKGAFCYTRSMTPEERIAEIEALMASPTFWSDKDEAQRIVREYQSLKEGGSGDTLDEGNATLAVLAGAGGDDAEDFAAMLRRMYEGYAKEKGWKLWELDANENNHGGYRSVLLEISGKGAYGRLKHEAGVHRLVRISPFNANAKRQTSFALVEVLPVVPPSARQELRPDDLDIQFAKSGGAGGQNVNKRETAVRITHIPSGVSVHVSSERSQQANREKALELVQAKLYRIEEARREAEAKGRSIATTTANEWGSQMRSYVLHPYKLVKDHETGHESHDPDAVLSGDLDAFIDAPREGGV